MNIFWSVIKGAIFLAGAWLAISPFTLSFTNLTTAMWTAIVGGVALMLFSLYSALSESYKGYVAGLEVVVGIGLVLAPFVVGFTGSSSVLWSFITAGSLTALFAAADGLVGATTVHKTTEHAFR